MDCRHNHRCRYTHGYLCEDCRQFFPRDSVTYRSTELLSSLWMVLHNLDASSQQKGGPPRLDAITVRDKLNIGGEFDPDYEALIAEAEAVMKKYGVNDRSADVPIG